MPAAVNIELFLERDMPAPEVLSFLDGAAAVVSARCPGKEGVNEDGALVASLTQRDGVLAVADGLGGGPAGETAARILLETLAGACAALGESAAGDPEDGLREELLKSVDAADRRIRSLGVGAAATLVAAEIHGESLRPYHVGDAHLLVVGRRGRIKRLTVAHAPVSYAVEAGYLDQDEALLHEDRHLVSNVVGAGDMRIEVGSPLSLAPFDTLLLASDGLFDNLTVDEIVESARKGPLLEGASALFARARERMRGPAAGQPSKPDDLTFLLFRRG